MPIQMLMPMPMPMPSCRSRDIQMAISIHILFSKRNIQNTQILFNFWEKTKAWYLHLKKALFWKESTVHVWCWLIQHLAPATLIYDHEKVSEKQSNLITSKSYSKYTVILPLMTSGNVSLNGNLFMWYIDWFVCSLLEISNPQRK